MATLFAATHTDDGVPWVEVMAGPDNHTTVVETAWRCEWADESSSTPTRIEQVRWPAGEWTSLPDYEAPQQVPVTYVDDPSTVARAASREVMLPDCGVWLIPCAAPLKAAGPLEAQFEGFGERKYRSRLEKLDIPGREMPFVLDYGHVKDTWSMRAWSLDQDALTGLRTAVFETGPAFLSFPVQVWPGNDDGTRYYFVGDMSSQSVGSTTPTWDVGLDLTPAERPEVVLGLGAGWAAMPDTWAAVPSTWADLPGI